MKWWSTNSQHLHLKQLASKYLCIPATSPFSKRCFSSARLTVIKIRMQLSGELLEAFNVMPSLCHALQLKAALIKQIAE